MKQERAIWLPQLLPRPTRRQIPESSGVAQ